MTLLPPSAHRLAAGTVLLISATLAQATELLVPAYFYPSYDPAQSLWPTMEAALAQGAKVTAIMNVANGPGTALNADYKAAVDHFKAAGGTVLGYVYSCYGNNQCSSAVPATRSVGEVLTDAQHYADWYGVDGIFLDEMASGTSALPFYQAVSTGLRSSHPTWALFGNPGTAIAPEYTPLFDTFVTYENGSASYAGAPTQPWMLSADPASQAHILYNVGTAQAMRELLAQAQARHAGYVYITDDRYTPGSTIDTNPFDQLPTYWQAEIGVVQTASVPEPGSVALMAAGLVCMMLGQRRRGRRQALGL